MRLFVPSYVKNITPIYLRELRRTMNTLTPVSTRSLDRIHKRDNTVTEASVEAVVLGDLIKSRLAKCEQQNVLLLLF